MISVIIPVYKTEQFLGQCLGSICDQTYKDLDIILIDDGSPDQCGQICEAYAAKDPRIRVYHTKNQGHYLCRGFALEKARAIGSKYIGFVDSDDWIEPDMYETLLKAIEEEQADISLCGYYKELPNKAYPLSMPNRTYDQLETLCSFFSDGFFDMFWNKLYRIECFDGIVFPDKRSYHDALINYSIYTSINKTVSVSAVKYHYRQVAQSIIHAPNINLINRWILNRNKYEYCTMLCGKVDDALYTRMIKQQTKNCAIAIAENWRWWEHHSKEQKKENAHYIAEMSCFSRKNLPLFGDHGWPLYLRVYSFLSHFNNSLSFRLGFRVNTFSHERTYY